MPILSDSSPVISDSCNDLPDYPFDCAFEPSDTDRREAALAFAEIDAAELLDRSESMTLEALAEHVATFFKSWGNGAGDLFARTMEELAFRVRLTQANSPAEYAARAEIIDRDARESWEAIGYETGKAETLRAVSAQRDLIGSAFGHRA